MEILKITKEEAEKIILGRKPLGLFYLKENNLYVAIDNSDGYAWTEEFDSKESCLKWLASSLDRCWGCGNDATEPIIGIHFDFEDGSDYEELVSIEEQEVDEWVQGTIEDKGWTNVKEYSHGLYCPHCLTALE